MPNLVEEAGERLRAGAVIAHPTDTVMGLAAAARLPVALARMAALKGRSSAQAFLCLIDEPARLDGLVHSVPRYAVELIARHWPGPLTLVLNARPDAPCRAPDGSVALRCPDHALTRRLIREVAGALASTSANRTGGPVAANAAEAVAIFGLGPEGLALALDSDEAAATDPAMSGGALRTAAGLPSTILDVRGESPILVRAGAISLEQLGLS